jgi:hypothetical protein
LAAYRDNLATQSTRLCNLIDAEPPTLIDGKLRSSVDRDDDRVQHRTIAVVLDKGDHTERTVEILIVARLLDKGKLLFNIQEKTNQLFFGRVPD